MPQFLSMIVSLIGVLGLMFLALFGLRMLNRRISTSGGRLRVIDRASLGRDSMILVVSVCGKLMLVGISSQRVEKLADLDMTEEEYVTTAFGSQDTGFNQGLAQGLKSLPFADVLSGFIAKKKEKENNEDKNKNDEK